MSQPVATAADALRILQRHGFVDEGDQPEIREIPVGYRLVRRGTRIGSADVVVTRTGQIRRVSPIVPDDEILE